MTQKNRENMQRAIGIIEGVAYGASSRVIEALDVACDILYEVLNSEEKGG